MRDALPWLFAAPFLIGAFGLVWMLLTAKPDPYDPYDPENR